MRGGAFLPLFIAYLTPMLIIMLVVYGSTVEVVAWKPPVLWTNQFGDPNMSNGVQSLSYANGSVYAAGFFNFTQRYIGSGTSFLREYRSDGDVLWTSNIGNFLGESTAELTVGSDGIYIIQADFMNSSLQSYDFKGNQLWSFPLEQGTFETSLSAWGQGVYVAGYSEQLLANRTIDAAFVREYDLNGSVLWTKSYNLSRTLENPVSVQGLSATSHGIYVLLSNSLFALTPNGQPLWFHPLSEHAYVIGADSTGVYVSGNTGGDSNHASRLFLEKFTFDGSAIWNDTFDSPIARPSSLSAGSSGVYLSLTNDPNNYLLRYDSVGNQIWSYQVPLKQNGYAFLVATGEQGPYLAGSSQGTSGSEAFIQSFGSSKAFFFFGVSPPWSLVLLASPFVGLTLVVYFVRKHYRKIPQRPRSSRLIVSG